MGSDFKEFAATTIATAILLKLGNTSRKKASVVGIEPSPTVDAKCDRITTELLGKSQLTVTTG